MKCSKCLVILVSILVVLYSCCNITNSYTWTNQQFNSPPQAMLDELSNVVNNPSCNPFIGSLCSEGDDNFAIIVLGASPAEAIQDNYGGSFGEPNGQEDFVIRHEIVNSSLQSSTFTVNTMNQIKDDIINKVQESAPYCSCQSRRAKAESIEVKAWKQSTPPLHYTWRRSLYITVTYHCCGLCV